MRKRKLKFKEAQERIATYLQENYRNFSKHLELNAIITHLLFSPDMCPPLMSKGVYKSVSGFFVSGKNVCHKKAGCLVKEAPSPNQLPFSFVYNDLPYKPPENPEFKFIDLFAGIGGFRIALQKAGGKCVFSCEWDKYAKKTYERNFGEYPYGDIKQFTDPVKISDKKLAALIPDHDVLAAGFPCQPFSLAGVSKKNALGRKHGFDDPTQGTLFFDIKRILKVKQPAAFFLENVKNLLSHDGKRTFATIEETLNGLGYVWDKAVIDGCNWVPQHRERVFIVGYNPKKVEGIKKEHIVFPKKPAGRYNYLYLKDIIRNNVDEKYTLGTGTWDTLERHKKHHKEAGNGFGYGLITKTMLNNNNTVTRTMSARYHKDGAEILIEQNGKRPRRLTVEEAMRLMGFDSEKYRFPVSDTQAYRQIGNSVVVPAVQGTVLEIVKVLKKRYEIYC